jgi:hypothetical protein
MTSLIGSLQSAANNVVSINRSSGGMNRSKNSYSQFLRFMEVETTTLKSITIDKKKLNKALSANVSTAFGNTGNLLGGLLNGALDIGGFLSNFVGGGKNQKGQKPPVPKAKPVPKARSGKVRLPGVRGLAILTPLLAGLDFAQGISEGESTGKAAAGAAGSAAGAAGGALAGAALAGAIGQVLVPVPGLGFVLGAAVGGLGAFAGGYLADRAYESVSGEGGKEGIARRLKEQEQKQKIAAAGLTQLTLPQVLDKFENVVANFERYAVSGGVTTAVDEEQSVIEQTQQQTDQQEQYQSPDGPAIAMEGEGTFIQGSTGRSTGPHFHIGPQENYGKPEGLRDAQEGAHKVAKSLLNKKIPFLLSNLKQWVRPSQKLSDSELMDLIKQEQRAHMNRSMGSSFGGIDIAAPYGTRLPFPVEDVRDRGDGFGISGKLVGTKAFVAHGAVGSKSTPKEKIKQATQPTVAEGTKPTIALAGQENFQPQIIPSQKQFSTQDLSKMSTDNLKGMLDPTKTGVSNPAVFQAATKARQDAEMKGLVGESLERQVLIASIKASQNTPMVNVVPSVQQSIPQQIQQYPSYNQPQSSMTIVPMIQNQQGQQQVPMTISSPGGNGQTILLPGPSSSQVLNSLLKTMLLTNLSST